MQLEFNESCQYREGRGIGRVMVVSSEGSKYKDRIQGPPA